MASHQTLQAYTDFARQTAEQAGKVLLDLFRHGSFQGSLKDDQTLVTAADHQADTIIREAIQSAYPDHAVLSEESQTRYPDQPNPVWVIDPLDGTTNFSRGLHHWGVSIALLIDGYPAAAALSFPAVQETFTAALNGGACFNGTPLTPQDRTPGAGQPFFMHCSRTHGKFQVDLPYKERTLGAAAYHFCAVAKGAAAVALETTVKLWDIAGIWLILQEGGAQVTAVAPNRQGRLVPAGDPFPPGKAEDYKSVNFTVLAADTPYHVHELLKQIKPHE